jgi:hypothetical protein
MATTMDFFINYVDADVNYVTTPADFAEVDLVSDYLIWTAGDAIVKDLMTHEPTASELNAAATVISDSADTTVALCLWMDYSHSIGGSYYTHKVMGMSENKRYVFLFKFDGATAMEPRLEAWDDSDHDSSDKHVLGASTPANSMVKAVCTTDSLPGASWVGTAIAGAANYVLLNAGNGALSVAKDLYANIKIVVPMAYATPAIETFVLTCRYTYF